MTMAANIHYIMSSGPEEHNVSYKLCLDDLDLALLPMNTMLNKYTGDYKCYEDVCEFEVFVNKCYEDNRNGTKKDPDFCDICISKTPTSDTTETGLSMIAAEQLQFFNENLHNKSKANNFGDLIDKEASETVNVFTHLVNNIKESESNKEKGEKDKVNNALNKDNATVLVRLEKETDKIHEKQIKNKAVLTNDEVENTLLKHNDDDNDYNDYADDGDSDDDDDDDDDSYDDDDGDSDKLTNEKLVTDENEKFYCKVCNVMVPINTLNVTEHRKGRIHTKKLNTAINLTNLFCNFCKVRIARSNSTTHEHVEEHIGGRTHRAAVEASK